MIGIGSVTWILRNDTVPLYSDKPDQSHQQQHPDDDEPPEVLYEADDLATLPTGIPQDFRVVQQYSMTDASYWSPTTWLESLNMTQHDVDLANRLLKKADIMCVSTPERKNRRYYENNNNSAPFFSGTAVVALA